MSKAPHKLSDFAEFVGALSLDPDWLLMAYRCVWQDTGNPYGVWQAILICTEHKRDFPDWVRDYLAQCAQRMDDAAQSKASNDLRAILPSVLGFPSKKRGRGHPLWPDRDESEYGVACMAFAAEITKGNKPSVARRNASMSLDHPLADKIDDKTLQTHIKRYFGVKKSPRTNAEWRKLLRVWYRETFGPLAKEFRELSP